MEFSLTFEIQAITGFQIQSGYGHQQFNQVVVRDVDGNLTIPASSLKGRLKYYVELFTDMIENPKVQPLGNLRIGEPENGPESGDKKKMHPMLIDLFGNEQQSGRLYFDAGRLKAELKASKKDSSESTFHFGEARTGTLIHRGLGSVKGKSLRFFEVAPRGMEFKTVIDGQLPSDPDWKRSDALNHLFGGLQLFHQLGADKSRGNGSVKIYNRQFQTKDSTGKVINWGDTDIQENLVQYLNQN